MPTVKLRPATIVGRRCVAAWKVGTNVVKVEITPAAYDALFKSGTPPGRPNPNATFLGAADYPVFDPPSGRLEAGSIVDKPEGYMIVKTGVGSPRFDRILVEPSKGGVTGTKDTLTVAVPVKGVTITDGFITF